MEEGPATLNAGDRIEIHELAARYGNAIDDRAWEALGRVFTDDAVLVIEGFGSLDREDHGLPAIVASMSRSRHPVAHHVTNVEVTCSADTVTMQSKIIGSGPRGRVGSADYHDVLRRTPDGWRIAHRAIRLRTVDEERAQVEATTRSSPVDGRSPSGRPEK
jgi:ketosteroid isomerase-like protein